MLDINCLNSNISFKWAEKQIYWINALFSSNARKLMSVHQGAKKN